MGMGEGLVSKGEGCGLPTASLQVALSSGGGIDRPAQPQGGFHCNVETAS